MKWNRPILETLVLSPFLYKGFTSEYFNVPGNVPVDKLLLNINVRGDKIWGMLTFMILDDMSL